MNYTKLKKEKLEVDYNIKKIENILDCQENLERYIDIIENDKLDTPIVVEDLNKKILERITNEKKEGINLNQYDKKDIKNQEESEEKLQYIKREKTIKNNDIEEQFIKRIKYKFTNVLKIAACTIFALMIWEAAPTTNTYAKKTPEIVTEQKEKNINNDTKFRRKVNDFFMSPIKIERREK